MIYQKIQKKQGCEELNAVYDRILQKHNQRIKRYFNYSTTNSRNNSSQRRNLESQFTNTIFNTGNEKKGLTFDELQDVEPFLFVQLCSKASSMLKNVKNQRKRSLNKSTSLYYFSLQKKKKAKRDFSQRKINKIQRNLFEENQLKEIEQNLNKVINQSKNSSSFFYINFMKLFQQKVSIVRKISIARRQSKYEQNFKCYSRAQKAIQDIKTSKDYMVPYYVVLIFRQDINTFLENGTELISFLGNRLNQLPDQSKEAKVPKQQLFSMEFILDGLQKARVKSLASILEFLNLSIQKIREYYESQLNNQIPLKLLSYLTTHFDSEIEYIALFVNKQLGPISKQFLSYKSFNPNITSRLFQNRPGLDNKQSQRLLVKIENNFSRSCSYISKMLSHIKQVSLLQNLLIPMPQLNNQTTTTLYNRKSHRTKRIYWRDD